MPLTTAVDFKKRLYLQDGQHEGTVVLFQQSNYPGSKSELLGVFSEKDGKIVFSPEDTVTVEQSIKVV